MMKSMYCVVFFLLLTVNEIKNQLNAHIDRPETTERPASTIESWKTTHLSAHVDRPQTTERPASTIESWKTTHLSGHVDRPQTTEHRTSTIEQWKTTDLNAHTDRPQTTEHPTATIEQWKTTDLNAHTDRPPTTEWSTWVTETIDNEIPTDCPPDIGTNTECPPCAPVTCPPCPTREPIICPPCTHTGLTCPQCQQENFSCPPCEYITCPSCITSMEVKMATCPHPATCPPCPTETTCPTCPSVEVTCATCPDVDGSCPPPCTCPPCYDTTTPCTPCATSSAEIITDTPRPTWTPIETITLPTDPPELEPEPDIRDPPSLPRLSYALATVRQSKVGPRYSGLLICPVWILTFKEFLKDGRIHHLAIRFLNSGETQLLCMGPTYDISENLLLINGECKMLDRRFVTAPVATAMDRFRFNNCQLLVPLNNDHRPTFSVLNTSAFLLYNTVGQGTKTPRTEGFIEVPQLHEILNDPGYKATKHDSGGGLVCDGRSVGIVPAVKVSGIILKYFIIEHYAPDILSHIASYKKVPVVDHDYTYEDLQMDKD